MDKLVWEALKFANDVRIRLGLQPVPDLHAGVREDCNECPISNTISHDTYLEVETDGMCTVTTPHDGEDVLIRPLTSEANQFVRAFDAGEFPEYIR